MLLLLRSLLEPTDPGPNPPGPSELKITQGGGLRTRRRRTSTPPVWLPDLPIEEEETLILLGII